MPKTTLSHERFVVSFLKNVDLFYFICFILFSLFFDLPTEVILSSILFPIKSHVAYAVF